MINNNKMRQYKSQVTALGASSEPLTYKAKLKAWDITNANGEVYKAGCYDKCRRDYYEANGKRIPVTVCHQPGIDNLVGYVDSIDDGEDGMMVTIKLLPTHPKAQLVADLIEAGVLQGVSDDGYMTKYYNNADGSVTVTEAFIAHVSLVDVPAEPTSWVRSGGYLL